MKNQKRNTIIAGNWKMYKSKSEAESLFQELTQGLDGKHLENKKILIFPPAIYLDSLIHHTNNAEKVSVGVGAQNCHQSNEGAFTGEISATQLSSIGVEYIIIGHSERREYFVETNELLKQKIDSVLSAGLIPVFCCGESLAQREEGIHFDFIKSQIEESLFHLSHEDFSKIIIAYEPIWAIGTGKVASPEQAQEIHQFIRKQIEGKYGFDLAQDTHIIYGGSVKPDNAISIFSQEDIDGGLIGGASLKSADFLKIILL